MGTADPAVDVEELDSVGFAAERVFSGRRQPQPEAREGLAVAERGRRGKWCAVVGFEEPPLSLPADGVVLGGVLGLVDGREQDRKSARCTV